MASRGRRVVTGHDAQGRSIVLSDGLPPQDHPMQGPGIGADFVEIWSVADPVPVLGSTEPVEPTARDFAIMPPSGHLIRVIEIWPLGKGGTRTPMHRTSTLDYVVVIEGELTLILTESEVVLGPGDVVVQRGTDHAWENRGETNARAAFFHIDARFSEELRAKLPEELALMR